MYTLSSQQPVPIYPFERDEATGSKLFTLLRSEGELTYEENLLMPHRKAYYLLVFVKHNRGRHWVDMTPYDRKDNTLYFSTPSQMLVKEAPTPFWPLKEIAFDLGFSDASYFNRFFKRETGATPAEYRATIRKMYQ